MGGTRVGASGAPYRESSKPVDPFTDAEMAFWDAVYVGYTTKYGSSPNGAPEAADEAVKIRRERFGVR